MSNSHFWILTLRSFLWCCKAKVRRKKSLQRCSSGSQLIRWPPSRLANWLLSIFFFACFSTDLHNPRMTIWLLGSMAICQDPSNRDLVADASPWKDYFDSPNNRDSFTQKISQHDHHAVRVVKSSEHIHTLDADGAPADTPQHVYADRQRHVFTPLPPLLSKNAGHLPTKDTETLVVF